MTNKRDPAPRKTRAQLMEQIESLATTVQELRTRNEHLEAERNQLQEENQSLRRELTHSRLLNHIEQSVADEDQSAESPPTAEQLYQALPPTFSFPVYFQIAEGENLGMEAARRCLQHFLAKKRIVRDGSRLRKKTKPFSERTPSGDGQSSEG